MAEFTQKNWLNTGDEGANANNSVLNKENMNDLENRIEQAINNLKTAISTSESKLQSSIKTLETTTKENIDKELYYKAGDTYVINVEIICSGFLTGGQSNVRWTLITDKKLNNINSATVNHIKAVIRHPDGAYLTGEGGNAEDLTKLGTLTCSIRGKNIIIFSLTFNEAKTQYKNNVPVELSIPDLGLTFK